MANARTKVIWILIAYFVLLNLFWLYSDQIGVWALTASPVLVTIVNLVTNPFYIGSLILIVELFFRSYELRRSTWNYIRVSIASVMVSLSLDIFSLLHTISFNYVIPSDPALSIYFDTILGKALQASLQPLGSVGTWILYVVIAFLMFVLALFIASPSKFLQIVKKEVGH